MWGTIKRALKFQPEDPCGVGIVFTEMEDGSLVVTGLLPNCPAELSQIVAMGDTLYEVDGVNYYPRKRARSQRLSSVRKALLYSSG
jgi:C-terminal processing protease CtpA/Prc